MSTTLSLNVLQESWDKSNRLYSDYRSKINQLHASRQSKKVAAADTRTSNIYRKMAGLEQERRKTLVTTIERGASNAILSKPS